MDSEIIFLIKKKKKNNEILKFDRVCYEKYNTSRINIIENGILAPKEVREHCEIIKIDEPKYGYRKVVVQLVQRDLWNLMEVWETRINDFLQGLTNKVRNKERNE